MGPTLWRLLAVMTEWVWDSGVRGAVGVVGVWGRLRGGEAEWADLDSVTLDTKLSWKMENKTQTGVRPLVSTDASLAEQISSVIAVMIPERLGHYPPASDILPALLSDSQLHLNFT